MSNEDINTELPPSNEEPFEEKRDSKGRRITKKRMESMRKNLQNANKSRVAKKQLKSQVQEYNIESESGSESDSSSSDSDDDELLEKAMKKDKKQKGKGSAPDPRIDRLENIVAGLAKEVKKSHKQMRKVNKPKSEKIVVLQPNHQQPQKKAPAKDRTDLISEMLKNNIMF